MHTAVTLLTFQSKGSSSSCCHQVGSDHLAKMSLCPVTLRLLSSSTKLYSRLFAFPQVAFAFHLPEIRPADRQIVKCDSRVSTAPESGCRVFHTTPADAWHRAWWCVARLQLRSHGNHFMKLLMLSSCADGASRGSLELCRRVLCAKRFNTRWRRCACLCVCWVIAAPRCFHFTITVRTVDLAGKTFHEPTCGERWHRLRVSQSSCGVHDPVHNRCGRNTWIQYPVGVSADFWLYSVFRNVVLMHLKVSTFQWYNIFKCEFSMQAFFCGSV